ncbi:hypothetical protein [Methylovulum psychrotolerans]|uniref:Uncharacterized protein n=1 Tax=Methylovulum psychrotolerans TaxID=1704499 RepID=A0A1Z4BY96_9GAMM|nr:hypothetical protein [Methylovulum psychrotolerans]ASF46229.1 hypothetical protein CEK71_09110 [Methylovulum psychrotolerans]
MSTTDDDFAEILADVMAFVTNEAIILNRLEEYFSPKPAKFADSEGSLKAINHRIEKIVDDLGGAPSLIIQFDSDPIPKYDTYPNAAFNEMFALFNRTRKSVTRAHMFLIGSSMYRQIPSIPSHPDTKRQSILANRVDAAFWEHAETCYIRLASYWDRVGQLMDFTFFGIRQFERDGFSSVMEKIHNNWVAIDPALRNMPAWYALRCYQKSDKADGLGWLLRRRNFLIHSMHLRPIESDDEAPLFESAFNHLDKNLREKLKPDSMEDEMDKIHKHLAIAASQLPNILSLLEYAIQIDFRPFPR